ncbi:MAG: hypothetical protein ACLPXT_06605 [Terracidiphilus sp.]
MRIAPFSIAVLLAIIPSSFAQTAPGPQETGVRRPAIPLQTTSGTGFTGAPYSCKAITVKEKTLTDGTRITETFVELIWRDAEGRTRKELIQHTDSGAEYRSIIITDPVGGMYRKWTEGYPSAEQMVHIWPLPPNQRVTAPPSPINSGKTESRPGFRNKVLTPQEINGVYAEGSRWVRTTQLTEEISKRVIEVTNELWISPELRIIMRHIHDDPQTGKEDTEVTDVVRGDPDPALFQAPEGYAVVDHRSQSQR